MLTGLCAFIPIPINRNAKNIKVAQFFKNREKNLDKLVSVNVGDLKMQNALIEVAENLRREINEVL